MPIALIWDAVTSKLGLIGIAGLAFLAFWGVESLRISSRDNQIVALGNERDRLKLDNQTLATGNIVLGDAIDEQNAAVQAQKKRADEASARADAAAAEKRGATMQATNDIAALRAQIAAARTPLPFLKSCELALEEARHP